VEDEFTARSGGVYIFGEAFETNLTLLETGDGFEEMLE
jgi:hypothetical protein